MNNVRDMVKAAKAKAEAEPEWFFRNVLNFDPFPWQVRATEAAMDIRRKLRGEPTKVNHEGKQRITIRAGHGPGKTHWLAAFTHIWNFTTYGLVAATAPKQDTLRTRYFYRYKRILANSAPWYRKLVKADNLKASVGGDETWGVQGETASEPENLAGYHDDQQLFLVDEASGRRMDAMYPTIEGALTTPGSCLVEIGNPTRDEGEFYQHHTRADLAQDYFRMHVRPEDAPGVISKEWIDTMCRKYGEDSPIFKVRVLGEFAPMDRNQLLSMSWIEAAREMGNDPDGSHPQLRISVDVADGGDDYTVITAALHYETFVMMLRQEKHNFPQAESPIRAADAAQEMFERYNGRREEDELVVDSIGVGAGTAGTLIDRGYSVVTFRGGEASNDPQRWRNRRVQSYLAMRDAHRDGVICYAEDFTDDWDEYVAQLCSIRTRPGVERLEDLETKEQHARRTRKSPDRADSAMMQFASKEPTIGSNAQPHITIVTGSRFADAAAY